MRSVTRVGRLERITTFLEEAGRRRVWRTALAYAAVVFVLLQLGEIVFPAFGAPEWSLRLLVVSSFLGFPLVLALAWAFDITPDGILRAQSAGGVVEEAEYSGTTLPRMALLGVTLVTVAGVGWWTVQDTLRAEIPGPSAPTDGFLSTAALEDAPLQVRSLAVLPLDDYSEEPGGEYFTAGFHEELISQLSQIGAARVVSRTSVIQYDRAGKAMPVIASDLGVEGVVEGSVFRDGNRVRITVQLIHGATDQHLWANSYEGTLEDAIGLQRQIATEIAREIRAEISPDEEWVTPEARVASTPRAQEEYLKGRFNRSKATPEGLQSAISHFEAAVAEDSSFAPAYAGLAGARFLLGFQEQDSEATDLLNDPAIVEPLEMAFRLDESSPEARAVLLSLKESFGDLPGLDLPEGITIVGDSAALLEVDIALTATDLGRQLHQVVIQHGRQAEETSRTVEARRLAQARRLQVSADFKGAERLVREAIDAAPASVEAWEALEYLKTVQGDFRGAAEVRKERLAQTGSTAEGAASLGVKVEAQLTADEEASLRELEARIAAEGEKGYWALRAEELQERQAQGKEVSPVLLARAFVGLDRTEEAFQELEAAVEKKDRNLVSLWADPAWDSIRSDPRFRSILSKARGSGKGLPFLPQ